MKPIKNNIHQFIYNSQEYFQIPKFQRPYAWKRWQIKTFIMDIEKTVIKRESHYFGSIVCVKEPDHYLIIDGQQRLTTVLLMLCAIYHLLKESPAKTSQYSADIIKNSFLMSKFSKGKIILKTVTTDDKIFNGIFTGLIKPNSTGDNSATKLFKAYVEFYNHLKDKDNLDVYIDALKNFEIVQIVIDKQDDNPQVIFENINSTGEPLSQGDKIRNWALMLNDKDMQELAYEYWKEIESNLTVIEKGKQIDYISDFFRQYLMCQYNKIIDEGETYFKFKSLLEERNIRNNSKEQVLNDFWRDITKYLEPFLFINGKIKGLSEFDFVKEIVVSFQYLDISVASPFLLKLLVLYKDNELTKEEVRKCFELIEVLFARRILYGLQTKGLNNRFPEFYKSVKKKQEENSGQSFSDCLSAFLLESNAKTIRIPKDYEIENSLKTLDFYSMKKIHPYYLLAKICDKSKDSALLHQIVYQEINLSIEHIMPKTLSQAWKNDLGQDCDKIYQTWINTLPNLTLTGYNSEYSNKSFKEKKTIPNGFNSSPLPINQYIAQFDVWNEESLKQRSQWLLEQIKKVWAYPHTFLPLKNENAKDYLTPFDDDDVEGSKPYFLILDDKEYSVKSWKQVWEKSLKYLYERYSDKFVGLIDNKDEFKVADKPLFSKMDKYNRGVEFIKDVWVETVMGANAFVSRLRKLLEYFEISPADCPIKYKLSEGDIDDEEYEEEEE